MRAVVQIWLESLISTFTLGQQHSALARFSSIFLFQFNILLAQFYSLFGPTLHLFGLIFDFFGPNLDFLWLNFRLFVAQFQTFFLSILECLAQLRFVVTGMLLIHLHFCCTPPADAFGRRSTQKVPRNIIHSDSLHTPYNHLHVVFILVFSPFGFSSYSYSHLLGCLHTWEC